MNDNSISVRLTYYTFLVFRICIPLLKSHGMKHYPFPLVILFPYPSTHADSGSSYTYTRLHTP